LTFPILSPPQRLWMCAMARINAGGQINWQ